MLAEAVVDVYRQQGRLNDESNLTAKESQWTASGAGFEAKTSMMDAQTKR